MIQDAVIVVKNAQGKILIEHQFAQPVSDVIVRSVMLGRRHFSVPESPEGAQKVMKAFDPWINDIQERIEVGCRISAVGTKYEAEVRQIVFQQLGIDPKISTPHLTGQFHFDATASAGQNA